MLSQFHYRSHGCPAPRKIFALKRADELCGVIVYSFPSPFCFGRSRVWKGSLKQLMQEVSVISRVIVHPKYRGIGLGEKLVRETLPVAGTGCVEAVAVMARYNPFFEKAGMQRIAESRLNPHLMNALAELETLGFHCALLPNKDYCRETILRVGRKPVLDVLCELSRKGGVPRKRLITLQGTYPKHEAFMEKIADLDVDELAPMLKRLSFLAQTKTYLFWRKP
jgi:GNAT superfamily N-acetyltransferase